VIAVPILGPNTRDLAIGGADDSGASLAAGVAATSMDEPEFHAFYSRTARPLRAYLVSASGNVTLADDLLQEAYYRFLRSDFRASDDTHRKNYLFRIATNLLRDHYRRRKPEVGEFPELAGGTDDGKRAHLRSDMAQALGELKPRDRQMLWLAYAEGLTHREIGEALGLKPASLRPMLFRARQRLAKVLRARGFGS
jgi:RNA polymerase sigma-70 factor (ECF subfamily)